MEAGSSWPQLLAAHPGQVPRPASQELLAPGFALLTAPTVSPSLLNGCPWPTDHPVTSHLRGRPSPPLSPQLLPLLYCPWPVHPTSKDLISGDSHLCVAKSKPLLSSSPWAEGVHPGGHPLLPTLSSPGFSASPTPLFLLPQGCSPADPLNVKHLVDLSGAGHCSGAGGTACLKHARSVTPWGLRS